MIAHVDADSFFASVIIRTHPEFRGKPLLAIGMGGGCVIAATYEAKAKGVKTGMPLFEARKLVPGAIEMAADFRETGIASEQIESILRNHCPIIEQMSIDEWYLDLTSLVGGSPGDPASWGREIQRIILQNTGLSVSVGIAGSKLLAKMAGEYRKPAGVTLVGEFPSPLGGGVRGGGEGCIDIETFLQDRPAPAIPGIGRQRTIKTDVLGWKTAWDVAMSPAVEIIRICGRPGTDMQRELLGERMSPVTEDVRPPKSISRCRTFKTTSDGEMAKAHLLKHLEYCVLKMRRWDLGCREISIWVRSPDFAHRNVHRKLSRLSTTVDEIAGVALSALSTLTWHGQRFNQIGLALTGLKNAEARQQSLFVTPEKADAGERLQEAMDELHSTYGRDSLTHAAALSVNSGTVKELDLPIVG